MCDIFPGLLVALIGKTTEKCAGKGRAVVGSSERGKASGVGAPEIRDHSGGWQRQRVLCTHEE